jgi:hypothetical protein
MGNKTPKIAERIIGANKKKDIKRNISKPLNTSTIKTPFCFSTAAHIIISPTF